MYAIFGAPSRALRRISTLITVAVAIAMLPFSAFAQATGPQQGKAGDPPGNNGTVKIVGSGNFDNIPNNEPHVGCTFTVEWYGYDQGNDIISKVKFEMQAPTQSVGLTVNGPSEVFVGGDPASGAGTSTGLDGREDYTLVFDGPPHPQQGYHLKLTVATPGSQGNDKKYKVFWVEGCAPYEPPSPGISLQKSVTDSNDADSIGSLGETLTYHFAVTNTGNVPLTNVTITDAKLAMTNVACVATLAVGETKSCPTKSYTVTAVDIANGSVHNTATASGKPPTGPNVSDEDDATMPTPAYPSIHLEKDVADSNDADTVASQGEVLTYSFVVTNTGNVPLTNVTITDAKLGMTNVACVASLAVGETKSCPTKSYTTTSGDVAAGKVKNTATATGTSPSNQNVSDDDDAIIATKTETASIHLAKSVSDSNDADSIGSLGETLTYHFAVTNSGNVDLTNVTITDAKLGMTAEFCVASLAVGETKSCPDKSYTVTPADINNGSVHNTATGTGEPPSGPPVSDEDDATMPTPAYPSIHLEKGVVDSNDADTVASQGEVLTYSFVVTNTGNVPLTNVTITDAKLAMTAEFCVADLAVGETKSCPTKSYTTTSGDVTAGRINNTATATGTSPSSQDVSDDDDATIATKTAAPAIFLAKSVADSADADERGSEGEVLTYTFHVTNTGNVDLIDVTISDPMFNLTGAPCVASLPVGATTDCPLLSEQTYTVDADDVAHGSVDNTATTSGKPPTGPNVTDDDTASIPTEGGDPDEAGVSITKYASVSIAAPGDTVTYTLNVRNTGAGDAEDVVVTDSLPGGTTYVSSSAPCTYGAPTVTCALGTIESGDDASVTITVKVNAIGGGNTSHDHQFDVTKIEAHVSLFDGDTSTTTAECPTGYVATDGSVRLDHVDQGTGTFEDAVVLASGVTANGRGWVGTVRNDSTGQLQAKVNVVCATEKTVSGEDHSHPLVITGPVATTRSLAVGRNDIDLACPAGSYAITPSFVFTSGEGAVSTRRTPTGWRFSVDVDAAASGTFSIQCLDGALGTSQGHSHDLKFAELSDTVSVPAGGIVERRLTCRDGFKGIVAWADMEPGLVSLGNDPQPITRVFRFYNPTGAALSADFGLLCMAVRTNGGNPGDLTIKNTARVSTSSPDATTADDTSSASFDVTATGVSVAPRASVVSSSGRTAVRLALASSGKKSVRLKLLAMGKVKGTRLHKGSVLAKDKTKLHRGDGMVRLAAKGASAKAIKHGKVRKARLVVTSHGHRSVRVVKLHR